MTIHRRSARAGVTIIELIIAMVVGLIVLSTVTSYVGSTDRNMSANALREDYSRKARFLGIAFRRDLGEAGVGIESLSGFGTVAVFNDTITVLKVPFEPNPDPAYNLATNPVGATVTTNSSQNCGTTCMRLRRASAGTPLTLQAGMVARIQSGNSRRLILISSVGSGGASDSLAVGFRSQNVLLRRRSASSGSSMGGLTTATTTVQRLELVAYWRDGSNNLWRATRLDPSTGNFVGEIVATGCTQFEVELVFQDGGVATSADSTVAGRTYADINAIRITATLASDATDARINGGLPLGRTYVFQVQPRNLIYERNRDN